MENAKKVGLLVLGVAYQKYMTALEEQQEVLAGITDIAMNAFAMESVLLRTQKLASRGKASERPPTCAPSSCARPWKPSKARRARCWRPARKATRCARIWRC